MSLTFLFLNYFVMIVLYLFGFFQQEITSINNKSVFFGSRIPIGYERNEKLLILHKKYKRSLTISYIMLLIIVGFVVKYSSDETAVNFVLPASLLGLVVISVNYLIIHKKVQQLKKTENWNFDENNVVTVDTSFRENNADNGKLVISPWWFLIPLVMMLATDIIIGFKLSRIADESRNIIIFTMLIQAFINIALFAAYLSTKNAKQNLNGGTIHETRYKSRKMRYYLSVSYLLISVYLNIVFSVVGFSACGIVDPNFLSNRATQFLATLVPVTAVIIIVVVSAKSSKRCKNDLSSVGEKKLINRDDDRFYKFGVFYYNKNDPALFVEKRMGFGLTFNFARPAGKIVGGLMGALIGAMLIGMIFFMPGLTKERQVHVSQDIIKIEGVWGQEIGRQEISRIALEKLFPEVLLKTNGAAINKKLYGWFRLRNYDRAVLFIGDKTKPFVAIYLKDNTLVLINYKDESKTTDLYNEITSKMNLKEAG